MNKKDLVKSKKPYVYIQFLDRRPVWVGSGVGGRAWHTWDKSYNDRHDDVEVHIVCICETRQEAYDIEDDITQMYMSAGVKLCNHQIGNKKTEQQKNKIGDANSREKNPRFKGITIGERIYDHKIVTFYGRRSMDVRGFNSGAISQCILGNRNNNYRGYEWSRTTDIDLLQNLLDADNFVDGASKEIIQNFLSK